VSDLLLFEMKRLRLVFARVRVDFFAAKARVLGWDFVEYGLTARTPPFLRVFLDLCRWRAGPLFNAPQMKYVKAGAAAPYRLIMLYVLIADHALAFVLL
jgi:hypothetical protein